MNFKEEQQQCESVDGFLHSENVWGAARHVVLDELFKGAIVRTSFGGTVIDLRHTHIALGETYIDLDCSWGGVEIYVPSDWKVVFKCNTFFGGCDDKRWHNGDISSSRYAFFWRSGDKRLAYESTSNYRLPLSLDSDTAAFAGVGCGSGSIGLPIHRS